MQRADKSFKLHWLSGIIETVSGETIENACKQAGIVNGALKALDYWEEVQDKDT